MHDQPTQERADPTTGDPSARSDRAAGVVIAIVTEDATTDDAIGRAIEHGRRGAQVILYDVGATGTIFESPLPTEWSSDDLDRRIPPALTADQLDTAGQSGLARRVRALAEAGVDAYGWLPEDDHADSLARYADGMSAGTVIATEGVEPEPSALREAGLDGVEMVGSHKP